LDESGPAHKKKFTVKLVLCHGQEFEGSGPSIKKAQQAAAQFALDSTTLSKPPQIRNGRRPGKKDEPSNPILLLNIVSAQIGINVRYKEELIRSGHSLSTTTPIKPMPNLS
jgi:double-stranded RNA-binding protein Staufen